MTHPKFKQLPTLPVSLALAAAIAVVFAATVPVRASGRSPLLLQPGPIAPKAHAGPTSWHGGGMPWRPHPYSPYWKMGWGGPGMAFHRRRYYGGYGGGYGLLSSYALGWPAYDYGAPAYVPEPVVYNPPYDPGPGYQQPVAPVQTKIERPIIISTGCRTTKKLVNHVWRRIESCNPTIQRF